MGLYADVVMQALEVHAPGVVVELVPLCSAPAGCGRGLYGQLSMLQAIHQARQASARVRADVCHLLDGSFGYMATGLPMHRTLVTVHDLIPALQARGCFAVPSPGWAARRLINSSLGVLRRAGAVYAISASTAHDVLALTRRSVDAVVHNPLRPLSAAAIDLPAPSEAPFVLHVGNNGFYKNREGVLRIFAAMVRKHPALRLAMAGPEPTGSMVALARELGIDTRVDWIVAPKDEDLGRLYRQARLLLFPSWYEGFGWPPLEAMAFGCPSVCADTGSLPEVVGDAALIWNPSDIEGFATQALRLLDDSALVRELSERGQHNLRRFNMRSLAEGLLPLYQRLAQ